MNPLKAYLHPSSGKSRLGKSGFALIVTLSLMILLTVIAVGLLSLSSLSLRSSSQGDTAATARANARMALMLAIGELQKQTGPDTRVTATATIHGDTKPAVLGAWKSWEGTDHDANGRPVSPGNYASVKQERFLGWLTSGNMGNPDYLPDTIKAATEVTLVGKGSVGTGTERDKLQIHLEPTTMTVANRKSALAWWIGGENQKARLPKPIPEAEKPTNIAEWTSLAKFHAVADPKPFRMETLLTDPTPSAKTISLKQSDLIAANEVGLSASQEFFHDLSATSVGLLTNTATGGWRKDLSLLTENWSSQPSSGLPLFQTTPGVATEFTKPSSSNPFVERSLFYPWSAYRSSPEPDATIYRHGAVSSWENLVNWATLYRTMSSNGTSIASQSTRIHQGWPAGLGTNQKNQNHFNFLHKVRILPIIARAQWVFSYWAESSGAGQSMVYKPRLLMTPVIILWNPYNVSITSPALTFTLNDSLPTAFRFKVGTTQNTKFNSISNSDNYSPSLTGRTDALQYKIASGYPFGPGETRIFSASNRVLVTNPPPANLEVTLTPGVRTNFGHALRILRDNGTEYTGLSGATPISAEARFDTAYRDTYNTPNTVGISLTFDMNINNAAHLAYRMKYASDIASAVYKPISSLQSATLSEVSGNNTLPFLTTFFGTRSGSNTYIPAKGFVQTSPLVNYTAMGLQAAVEGGIKFNYPGCAHPVNSPFDYDVRALAGAGDSFMPNTDSANRGFIVTGFTVADGLSRCVVAELPTKPIQSLAELQNWDLRYENPIPPFSFNIIANSDASPLLPADAVFNAGNSSKGKEDLQHDDSYCANHLLFDDWFVSSIAPNSPSLGKPGSTDTPKKAYQDLVSGTKPLPNRAYTAILSETTAATEDIFDVTDKDSWKTVASRLEVEGMFNVNSTSEKAWRALLGHARNLKTAHLTPRGTDLSAEEDHAFSRFSVAGDTEAKSIGTSGAFSTSAEYAGYRKLDTDTLDLFAKEIVKQVRLRGPFLSLSEFVNRQLSSGDLALAGTIQSALNELQKNKLNPYAEIETTPAASDPAPTGTSGYKFPDAAVGSSTYGLPGWTRQADVLRPIAPILSARDDTFVIRGYGDARDTANKITARATCEAVVRRTRDYVDPADASDIMTLPKSPINLTFGRRYEIVSFRWLGSDEV